MKRWTGTSGFSYAAWKGKFYPPKIPATQMLTFYGGRLSAVEINSSFYRLPLASTLIQWASLVPGHFLFTFKAPGAITHRVWNASTASLIEKFIAATAVLGDHLGPLLFQFPPSLKKDPSITKTIFKLLPKNRLIAFEFRHPSWFDAEIFDLLREQNIALVYNDADVECMPFVSTANWGYLRLRRTEYTEDELQAYFDQCLAQKWKDLFVFFKHEDGATAPALAARWEALKLGQKRHR